MDKMKEKVEEKDMKDRKKKNLEKKDEKNKWMIKENRNESK